MLFRFISLCIQRRKLLVLFILLFRFGNRVENQGKFKISVDTVDTCTTDPLDIFEHLKAATVDSTVSVFKLQA